jgi:antitoxin component of RelBE/YafQ-DinJ toxin-antitoxin module
MKLESITIRIAEDEKEQLRAVAERLDVPMSQLIRQAIKEIIQKEAK